MMYRSLLDLSSSMYFNKLKKKKQFNATAHRPWIDFEFKSRFFLSFMIGTILRGINNNHRNDCRRNIRLACNASHLIPLDWILVSRITLENLEALNPLELSGDVGNVASNQNILILGKKGPTCYTHSLQIFLSTFQARHIWRNSICLLFVTSPSTFLWRDPIRQPFTVLINFGCSQYSASCWVNVSDKVVHKLRQKNIGGMVFDFFFVRRNLYEVYKNEKDIQVFSIALEVPFISWR